MEKAKQFVEKCDTSGDGKISIEELRAALSAKGHSEEQVQKFMKFANKNADEYITVVELARALTNNCWDNLFDSVDKDGSGTVSAEELIEFHRSAHFEDANVESLERFLADKDTNKDGQVSKEEFLAWLRHQDV